MGLAGFAGARSRCLDADLHAGERGPDLEMFRFRELDELGVGSQSHRRKWCPTSPQDNENQVATRVSPVNGQTVEDRDEERKEVQMPKHLTLCRAEQTSKRFFLGRTGPRRGETTVPRSGATSWRSGFWTPSRSWSRAFGAPSC